MKIYVDKKPKSKMKCPFYDKDNDICLVTGFCFSDGYDCKNDCSLILIKEHDKRVIRNAKIKGN